jgi:ferredoxin
MAVRINLERCMGNALCVGIAPGVFDLDADGYAVVIASEVDPGLAAEAARICPTNAIEVIDT